MFGACSVASVYAAIRWIPSPNMLALEVAAWVFLSFCIVLVVGMVHGTYPRWYSDMSCVWRAFTIFLLVCWLAIPVALLCGV